MSAKEKAPHDPKLPADDADEPQNEASTEEKVGYRRPPKHAQWQPGQSGNRRGRPPGSKGIDQILREALAQRVPDPRGGRRTVSMLDIIVRGLVLDAARRDHRAVRLLLLLVERYGSSDAERISQTDLSAADREILEEYLASITPPDRDGGE
jgi:hypothetical protein